MNWLFSVVRIVGSSLPLAPLLVQLQAEVDSAAVQRRLLALEEPVAVLHPDIRKLSEKLYKGLAVESENLDKELAANGVAKFRFDDAFLTQYSKPLAILEKMGFIQGMHSIGGRDFDAVYPCVAYAAEAIRSERVYPLSRPFDAAAGKRESSTCRSRCTALAGS